ncbi:MAG: HlyD family efflux transporter periplasmic adaptor subunit [Proteobacteria bacterium]|nr:HlyD family efflux transporter periplasmic adaptor subunit [Pseudomonadota bacterium]
MSAGAVADMPDQEAPHFDELALPELRQDLRLIEGGAGGGALAGPGWRIHDPLAQRFFAVDDDAVHMLARWGEGTVGAMRKAVANATGRLLEDAQVAELIEFVQRHELVRPQPQQTFARVRRQPDAQRHSWSSRLLHGYLFFKVPLARPDAFLRRAQGVAAVMFHPAFWVAAAVLGLFALYLVSRQWERFVHTFPDMFSVAGVLTIGASLALTKTLHELGHGFAAVRFGSRVTTMGVAFVVMTPILYTDTTDAWRLSSRGQRVLIDAAGMLVELLVAVVATLAWVFLPDGAMRHAAFALATTGWVLSLAVNLNPLMRFDGYYLFSDLIGVPNLQERAFAMGRWWLRELLFGFGDKKPEPAQGRHQWLLIGFSYATWVYRFFLFLGIALLVYHYFFKLLGIFLFLVEIGWFVVLPAWREFKVWLARRSDAAAASVRRTLLILLGLGGVAAVPLPYTVRIPAVLSAARQAPAFAPRPAQIESVRVRAGDPVRAGQVLLALSAPAIEQDLRAAQEREQLLQERIGRRASDERDLDQSLVLERELHLERDRIAGLERERTRLLVRAPLDGIVAELAPELSPGRWIGDKTRLALVVQPGAFEVRGYLDAQDVRRIQAGDEGLFVDEMRLKSPWPIDVTRVGAAAVERLDIWMLASALGGTVPALLKEGKPLPEQAVFEVVARTHDGAAMPAPLTEIRGEMQVRGRARSLAALFLRRVAHVLVREAGA